MEIFLGKYLHFYWVSVPLLPLRFAWPWSMSSVFVIQQHCPTHYTDSINPSLCKCIQNEMYSINRSLFYNSSQSHSEIRNDNILFILRIISRALDICRWDTLQSVTSLALKLMRFSVLVSTSCCLLSDTCVQSVSGFAPDPWFSQLLTTWQFGFSCRSDLHWWLYIM